MRVQQVQMSFDMVGWEYDEEMKEWIPAPIKEYPLIDFGRCNMPLNPDLFTSIYKPDVLSCLADLSNDEVLLHPM